MRKVSASLLPGPAPKGATDEDRLLQLELEQFLSQFSWPDLLSSHSGPVVRLLDVGARNFFLAPVLQRFVKSCHKSPELHGIELDPYRRLSNLSTRWDYGRYYAQAVENGFFHPQDFLSWKQPAHGILLLNPFVTTYPQIKWGLSLECFKPHQIFRHAFNLTRLFGGFVIVSFPSPLEKVIGLEMAIACGFEIADEVVWKPSAQSLQKKPRLGFLLK